VPKEIPGAFRNAGLPHVTLIPGLVPKNALVATELSMSIRWPETAIWEVCLNSWSSWTRIQSSSDTR